jgi:membrane-associated phospholipid phosphatase
VAERACGRRIPPKYRIIALRLLLSGLTGFGDTAVLMPLAAAMLVWFLAMRSPRDAGWWAIAVALCIGTTVLLKVSFYGCPPTADLHNPSGHTSLSTLVYGAVALVTARETEGMRRILAVGGAAGLILVIAVSRVLLHKHSVAEITVGLVVGTGALALFGSRYMPNRAREMSLLPLFIAGAILVSVLHGRELRADEFLHQIASYLSIHCNCDRRGAPPVTTMTGQSGQ